MTLRTLGPLLAEITPTPSPSEFDTDQVTPGVVGFVVTFAVALLVILLVVDMVRRVRRVNYRSQIAEDLDAEERELAENGKEPDAGSDTSLDTNEQRPDNPDAPWRP